MLTRAGLVLSNSPLSLVLKPHAFLCLAGARLGVEHPAHSVAMGPVPLCSALLQKRQIQVTLH